MNSNQTRVFFHELGHFVAHEIIFRAFGIHKTERIEIKRIGFEYVGQLFPTIPEGQDPNTPLTNKSEKIVELIYGCIFQAIYLGGEFKDCFNHKSNGCDDASAWAGILGKIGYKEQVQTSLLQNEYFANLKESGSLDNFFKINPSRYIIDISSELSIVDIDALVGDINEEIEHHKEVLLGFVEEIRVIINK